ncbi:hypothetical protein LPJ73_007696 [Coemansia sp. RSA 2703]|nr:hypothetical protein LPJ73_007696 [Coemansia sp. RSA 2703]KAJ2362876.1 hypothetical protein IW150_006888 [Coemansia sp. RSA 2607]
MLSTKQPTLALCAIGSELLNGHTQDANVHPLAQLTFSHGITLRTVHMVTDDMQQIAQSLKHLVQTHDAVFTTGGVGPTHDDITYDAVGRTFGREMRHHEGTLARMRRMMQGTEPDPEGSEAQRACARMALFPEDAQVCFPCDDLWVPVVSLNKVHVFPGVPWLFAKLVRAYVSHVWPGAEWRAQGLRRVLVATEMRESMLAPVLERLQRKYADSLSLGSYPQWPKDKRSHVVVSAEGTDEHMLAACKAELVQLLDGKEITNGE